MTIEPISNRTFESLNPFGGLVNACQPGMKLIDFSIPVLKDLINQHRVIILRGFACLAGNALPEFCLNLGEILEWEFGAVNELVVKEDKRNYLYTNREVPFHWDGAFVNKIPHYIFFHCDIAPAPESGGETIFCDTTRLLECIPAELLHQWEQIEITYRTEKIVHYGGTFTAPMISHHPVTGEKILRYAEPVSDLNPVELEIKGILPDRRKEFLADMHDRLHDQKVCYAHQWFAGDIVIADNFALLHGRRAFEQNTERRIRRVNIL